MSASPLCQVKDGAGAYVPTVNGVDVTAGDTISVALVSVAGVKTWSISVFGTDELQVAATINASLVIDGVNKIATFTMPAAAALGFQSTVTDNNGVSVSTTFGIYARTNGLRVGFVGETIEGSAAYGTAAMINSKVRQAAGGGGATPWHNVPRATKTANYTVITTDFLIVCMTNTGFTVTLPSSPSDGDTYCVSNQAAGTNTVNGGGHNINGAATIGLAQYQSITFTYDLADTRWIAT